jgi:DNA-directed RNA polymerase subunit RPC12/RpoP
MARLATCPKCRNQFTLPELSGPATIACPFCGAHITIKMKQTVPPPAMVVQPTMIAAQAITDDEDDYEEEEQPRKKTKKKKKKKKKKLALDDIDSTDENWLKAAILLGILLITVVSVVLVFVVPIWQHKSKPNILQPTAPLTALSTAPSGSK